MVGREPTTQRLELLVFRAGGARQGVPLQTVRRVLRAVEVTPVPGGPPVLMGVIDMGGCVMPVFSVRRRLGQDGPLRASDQLVVVATARRELTLLVDEIEGVMACDASQALQADSQVPSLRGAARVALDGEGAVLLVHDVEAFLTPDEAREVSHALEAPA